MKKLAKIIAASIMILGAANGAQAAQFFVELEYPISGDDAALRESLNVVEITSFPHFQNTIVVFEVNNIDVLQAYFYAKGLTPLSVLSFPTAWADAGVKGMTIEARVNMLNNIECDFCVN